jgi:hypothetical protein
MSTEIKAFECESKKATHFLIILKMSDVLKQRDLNRCACREISSALKLNHGANV